MTSNFPHVKISSQVLEAGLFACFVAISNAKNNKKIQEFEELKEEQYQRLESKYTQQFISHNKILQGFRNARKALGILEEKYPASPEKLLEYFVRNKKLSNINILVDIGNYVSLETLLSIGVHRLDAIKNRVALQLTTGTELFIPLGVRDKTEIPAGEFAYFADESEIICRMDYMQCDRTKLSDTTSECLFIVEGNASTSMDYVNEAAEKIVFLTKKYCGGQSKYLNPERNI